MNFGKLQGRELAFERGMRSGAAVYLRRASILLLVGLGGLALVGLLAALVLNPLSVLALAALLILAVLLLVFDPKSLLATPNVHSAGWSMLRFLPFAWLFARSEQGEDSHEPVANLLRAFKDSQAFQSEQRGLLVSTLKQLQQERLLDFGRTSEALSSIASSSQRQRDEMAAQLRAATSEVQKAIEHQTEAFSALFSKSTHEQRQIVRELQSAILELRDAIQHQTADIVEALKPSGPPVQSGSPGAEAAEVPRKPVTYTIRGEKGVSPFTGRVTFDRTRILTHTFDKPVADVEGKPIFGKFVHLGSGPEDIKAEGVKVEFRNIVIHPSEGSGFGTIEAEFVESDPEVEGREPKK